MDHDGIRQPSPLEQGRKTNGLGERPRVAIQQEPVRAIRPGDPIGNNPDDDVVAYQSAAPQSRAGLSAELGAGLAFGAKHLPRGNGWNLELFRKEGRLRAFAASGRTK